MAYVVREWDVPSESRPGVSYMVTLHLEDRGAFKTGSFSCSCPAWRFQRRPVSDRVCKHIKSVQVEVEALDIHHAIREVKGSEVEFRHEASENGRLSALIDTIVKLGR